MGLAVFGPYPFTNVMRTQTRDRNQTVRRQIEKGVQASDHSDDMGEEVTLEVYVFGNYAVRNAAVALLKQLRHESRKNPLTLSLSDPFEVIPNAVLEELIVDNDTEIKYGPTAKAWFPVTCRFVRVDPVGGDALSQAFDAATETIAAGLSNTKATVFGQEINLGDAAKIALNPIGAAVDAAANAVNGLLGGS